MWPSRSDGHETLIGAVAVLLTLGLSTACSPSDSVELGQRLDGETAVETAEPVATDPSELTAEASGPEELHEPAEAAPAEAAPAEAAPDEAPSNTAFSELRVCGPETLDESLNRCGENEAGRLDVSSAVFCSATVTGSTGGELLGQLRVGGVVVRTYDSTVGEGRTGSTWFGTEFDDIPLPGGDWTCTWSLGGSDEISLPFPLEGESGPLAWARACDDSATTTAGMCRIDADEQISSSDELVCSTMFVGLPEAEVEVALYSSDELLQAVVITTSDDALSLHFAYFSAGGDGWPASDYRCVWTGDGELGRAPITVTG